MIRWWLSDSPLERAAEVVEALFMLDDGVGAMGDQARRLDLLPIGFERHLTDAPRATKLVDAGVLGDLVQPWLEGDRPFGGAEPAQRGDEYLLRDVLSALVIPDHPEHVGPDPRPVTRIQLLERAIVTAPDGGDQLVLGARRGGLRRAQRRH